MVSMNERRKEGDKKQPYYIYWKDKKLLFFAAIGKQPFDAGDEAEGFLIGRRRPIRARSIFMNDDHWLCRQKLHANGCSEM